MLQTTNGQDLRIIRVDGRALTLGKMCDILLQAEEYRDEREPLAEKLCKLLGEKEYVFVIKDSEIYELSIINGKPVIHESQLFQFMVFNLRKVCDRGNYTVEIAKQVLLSCDSDRLARQVKTKKREQMKVWRPRGYTHVEGDIYSGYVIADKKGNQFVFIPYLDIYISRYEISQGPSGEARSVPNARAWTNLTYKQAEKAAKKFDPNYNSSLVPSLNDVVSAIRQLIDSSYVNHKIRFMYNGNVEIKTGAYPSSMGYNIDCLFGNHYCMIELPNVSKDKSGKVHGFSYRSERKSCYPNEGIEAYITIPSKEVGFRICLKRD